MNSLASSRTTPRPSLAAATKTLSNRTTHKSTLATAPQPLSSRTTSRPSLATTPQTTLHQISMSSSPSSSRTTQKPSFAIATQTLSSRTTHRPTSATSHQTTLHQTSMTSSPLSSTTTLKSPMATATKTSHYISTSSNPEIPKHESLATASNSLQSTVIGTTTYFSRNVAQYGTIVVVILGAIIVLGIVSALIVCRIRSIGIFKNASKKSDTNIICKEISHSTPAQTDQFNKNVTYEQVMEEDLGKKIEGANEIMNISVPIRDDADPTYTDSGNNEYDMLNAADQRRICTKENLYDSASGFRNMDDPTYHISNTIFIKMQENDTCAHTFQNINMEFLSDRNVTQ